MIGIIILAAGSSSRLGQPKQNLVFHGQTLLQRAIEAAIKSVCDNVMVVLGANCELIKPTLNGLPVTVVYNHHWAEGMTSSVRLGVTELQKTVPDLEAVILMLCDQPFVDAAMIDLLVEKHAEHKGIIASAYNGTTGPPALFDRLFFGELLQLKGQEGAKKLLAKYAGSLISVPFLPGAIDIDTVGDYERLSGM